jgi:hypothetical protein
MDRGHRLGSGLVSPPRRTGHNRSTCRCRARHAPASPCAALGRGWVPRPQSR